jgi:putative SOS response-associated peptidase YedK
MLTTTATEPLNAVHDRMPVVLRDDAHETWLETQYCDPENVLELIRTDAVLKELENYPVRTLVAASRAGTRSQKFSQCKAAADIVA